MRALVLALVVAAPAAAAATTGDTAINKPIRLTAGGANQYMGVPSPDGRTVFYVTDRNATTEVMSLDLDRGGPRLAIDLDADAVWPRPSPDGRTVFYVTDRNATTEVMSLDLDRGGPRLAIDLDADAVWPRPSPDGRKLLFVSYREDATGDACVRDLAAGGGTRCLTGRATADAQPFWFPAGDAIGVVQREGLHGDLALRRVPLSGGAAATIVASGPSAPAVSPDGKWFAYVPVESLPHDPAVARVGVAFAMRAGRGIGLARAQGGARLAWVPALPGASGSPAFSADGRWLYFVQYLNDTNLDGAVDGDDHGVIFRAPFDPSADPPVGAAVPEQLTSAAWNCRYPSPGRERLVVTCSHEGALDVYRLPLEGAVPATWGLARIADEAAASRDHWEKLLLLGRSLTLDPDPARRTATLRRMVGLHLDLREFESATFYVVAASSAGGASSPAGEWAAAVIELIGHRSGEVRLVRGQVSERFLEGENARLARLAGMRGATPAARAMVALVRSEVLDVIGDEGEAIAAFRQADVAGIDDPEVLLIAADRGSRLLRLHGLRDDLLGLYAALASHPAMPAADRLRMADAYATELTRGRPRAEAARAVASARAAAPAGGELAFRLAIEERLLGIGVQPDDDVRRPLFETYKESKEPWRRKVLVAETATRAASAGHEALAYEFANSYVSWVRRQDPERRHAERLYRGIVLERAYASLAAGAVGDARAGFGAVTLQTDDLEAHAAFADAWTAEGKGDLRRVYQERYADATDAHARAFVDAWLAARDLPLARDGAAVRTAADAVIARLRVAADAFPIAWEIHHLWGYVAHQRWLWGGKADDAIEAQSRYAVALDLAATNPRAEATVRQALGLLLSDMGSHTAAARHLSARLAAPFRDPAAELSVRLALARSLFLGGRDAAAAVAATKAVALADATPALSRFLPVALDRAAICALAAGDAVAAAALYDRLEKVMPASDATARVKLLLGRGSASLAAGAHDRASADLDEARRLLLSVRELPPAPSQFPDVPARARIFGRDDYVALVAGMRAQALRGAGRIAEAAEALRERRDLVSARLRRDDLDEDLLDLAGVHRDLAEYAYRLGDRAGAAREVEAGLARAAEFEERTGTPVTPVRVALARAYAEIHLLGGVPRSDLRRDLESEVRRTYDRLTETRDPALEPDRVLLGTWLVMLRAEKAR
ncbi:MAG: PD40 domain-containing protein [Deltaproteobacteria bacterium]|nr:PD40 domain-containing protein [Deltaproteobacteria bacterium]